MTDKGVYVEALYRSVLGRKSDSGGFAYNLGRLNSGSTRESVRVGLIGSSEFKNMSSGDNTTWLRRLYRALYRKDPDTQGLYYWRDQLNAGTTWNRDKVILHFLNSNEYKNTIVKD